MRSRFSEYRNLPNSKVRKTFWAREYSTDTGAYTLHNGALLLQERSDYLGACQKYRVSSSILELPNQNLYFNNIPRLLECPVKTETHWFRSLALLECWESALLEKMDRKRGTQLDYKVVEPVIPPVSTRVVHTGFLKSRMPLQNLSFKMLTLVECDEEENQLESFCNSLDNRSR